MKTRYFLILLSFIFFSTGLYAQIATQPLGSGTEASPYQIRTTDNLYWITQNPSSWDKYFKQTSNLYTSSSSSWDSGAGFTPIGNSTSRFTGQYDGGGYSISDLYINRPTTDYVGMFGFAKASTIENVTLTTADITGRDNVGILVGKVEFNSVTYDAPIITNVKTSGEVNGRDFVGGVVGNSYSGTITLSSSSATVEGDEYVGGFLGINSGASIKENYAVGNVNGTYSVGGLIGEHGGAYSAQNSYATGAVTGTNYVGGLIGRSSASVIDCYASGNVTGSSNTGGLTGLLDAEDTITTSYWNETAGGNDNSLGTALTSSEMVLQSSFAGFDFSTKWKMYDGITFPFLKNNSINTPPGLVLPSGSGTAGDPYQISTLGELNAIRFKLTSYFILTADIDMTEATSSGFYWNGGSGFEPIGSLSSSSSFRGHLDGNGHSIKGLFINRPTTEYVGLFISVNGGSVSDLALIDVDITGESYTAALSGSSVGTITRNYVSGSVTGTGYYTGGLIGLGSGSTTISNNYSVVSVNGNHYVGGLLGRYTSGTFTKNYSAGTVTGNTTEGGFVGLVQNSPSVSNNYWDLEKSGLEKAAGSGSETGLTGLSSNEMHNKASFSDFDFEDIWDISEGFSYPFLRGFEYSEWPGALDESIAGRALAFNTGSLTINDNDAFDDLDSLTLETWIYLKSDKRHGIIEKHVTGESQSGWWIDVNTDITALFVSTGGSRAANSTFNPELNTWYHLAVTYNGTTVKMYVNGEDVSGTTSGSGSGTILNNNNAVLAGRLNWTSSGYMDGNLDEIRIWNTVRTADQITENMFQKLKGDENGLITYLPLDEAFGSSVGDKSPTESTATLNSGVSWTTDTHPYGTIITGNEGWRIMASPVNGVSYGELLDTLWTQGFTGADKTNGNTNVMVWDESTRTFSSIANATDVPAVGSGFITYVYDDNNYDGTADGFPKMIKTDSTQKTGWVSPTLSFTSTGTLSNDGWNLVGNPYGATIDWDAASGLTSANLDASFYVWSDSANSGAGDYLSWNGSTGTFGGGKIAPWQGFWVKANATSPALTLTDEIRSGGGILLKQAPVSQIGFSLANEAMSSKTIMMFSDNASIEKDGLDAYKLQSLNAEYLSVFTRLNDGSGLDINAIPSAFDENTSIDLDLDGSALAGDYELSWNPENLPDGMTLTLVDNETGTEIDLSKASSYSFEIESETATKAQNPIQTQDIASPQHRVISPKVMKAKSTGSRFTIQINSKTSVSNESAFDFPQSVELQQNYPNPFNPTTSIAFGIPESGKVRLEVFDVLGRKVATLINSENKAAGRHTVNFDAKNLSSGMYIYRLQAGNTLITKKLTLIK